MNLTTRLEKLVPDLAGLTRFPVAAAISVLLCAYVNYATAAIGSYDDGYIAAGGAAAFLGAGVAHLFAEGRGLPRATNILLALAVAVAAALAGYFTRIFQTHYLYLFAGLMPLLMIAPYLHRRARQGALWLYNLRLGLAALLAAIVALAFALGLSAIVEALYFLFGVSMGAMHEHVWGTAMTLIAPIYGLSLMPRNLDEEVDIASHKDTLIERGVSVLVNYVLVPVIVVYALILHAYAVKIVLQQALPNGQIATMVSIFAVGGTGAWLIAWPWRETGTRLLRLFMRGWFWLTLVPAALLVVGIWRRIADYGVTPDRYGIAMIAVWIVALTAYLALRRNRADMRAILGAMAVLLIVGSVGPMGANGLTIKSQLAQFARLLTDNGLMKDGKAIAGGKALPTETTSRAYSILSTLTDAGGLEGMRPWFEGVDKNPFATGHTGWTLYNDIAGFFGIDQPQYAEDEVNYNAALAASSTFTGTVRVVGPLQAQQRYQNAPPQEAMSAAFDETTLTIKLNDRVFTLPLGDLMGQAKAQAARPGQREPLRIDLAPDALLLIDSIFGDLSRQPPLYSARLWLIIRSGV